MQNQCKICKIENADFQYSFSEICIKCECKRKRLEILEWLGQIQNHLKNIWNIDIEKNLSDKQIISLYGKTLDFICELDDVDTYLIELGEKRE